MKRRAVKTTPLQVSIAMKVSVNVPDYKLGKKDIREFGAQLARKMLAHAEGQAHALSGCLSLASDFRVLPKGNVYSSADTVNAPSLTSLED
jgi:hypothetical protein